MSARWNYTPEEWELLYLTPLYVGTAVATTSKSGVFGSLREALTVATGPASVAKEFPENALIQALVARENSPRARDLDAETFARDIVTARDRAFDACHQVCALLEQKANAAEAAEYRRWVLRVAETVARSAREDGGFLGIGGGDGAISEDERHLMESLRREIGLC